MTKKVNDPWVKKNLKVGDWVETNGNDDVASLTPLEGMVGKINDSGFYIWHNDERKCGWVTPEMVGFKYSWFIAWDNPEAYIKIIKSNNNFKTKGGKMLQKLTTSLKRVLSPNLQKQYRAGILDGNLELTELGQKELLQILAVKFEKELTEVAKEIIKEEEKNN